MSAATQKYSSRFTEAGAALTHRGAFFQEEANNRGLALVEAKYDDTKLFFLVEPESETIVESRYFTYGGTRSMAVAEAICLLVDHGPLTALFALSAETVDRSLRDAPDTPSAPLKTFAAVSPLALSAEENWEPAKIVWQASQIIRAQRANEPVADDPEAWLNLSSDEQRMKIDRALDGRVRDYLQAEGGDVEILDVLDGNRVEVHFSGMCGSCASSSGSTLYAVEEWIREKVYPRLTVIPV